jgi:hypothetical protein
MCSLRLISNVTLLCCSLRSVRAFYLVGSRKSSDFLNNLILGYGTVILSSFQRFWLSSRCVLHWNSWRRDGRTVTIYYEVH